MTIRFLRTFATTALTVAATAGLIVAPARPTPLTAPAEPGTAVRVNQIGYLTGAVKIATVVADGDAPRAWAVLDAGRGRAVASGWTRAVGADPASGDQVHRADFSALTAPGRYVLTVAGFGRSVPFAVTRTSLYPSLGREAMQYFYFHRMGTRVEGRYLQSGAHGHEALHPGDASLPCYRQWCGSQRLSVRYSWADAGDFGVYPVNHAVSAWTLLNLHERYPDAYPDGSLRIPENGNGRPDIVDEAEFGSRFLPGMLPERGLASHKVHNHEWSPFPLKSVREENAAERSAMPPSTNATYAVARTGAQLARVLAPHAPQRADELWASAEDAWRRASAQPDVDYAEGGNGREAKGGGDYPDTGNDDDRYAAAAELYLTAMRRGDASTGGYRTAVTRSRYYGFVGSFGWRDAATTGTLSLLSVANLLPYGDLRAMSGRLARYADRILGVLEREGYPSLLPGNAPYPWGSNSVVANKMIVLGTAYDVTGDTRYLRGMHRAMDYLMGNNPLRLSYVTGYGESAETDLHDRLAWALFPNTPFPRGWLAGGPNNQLVNDPATPKGAPPAKSYAKAGTAPSAWGSKENTINWNAPLVWVATYLDRTAGDLSGS